MKTYRMIVGLMMGSVVGWASAADCTWVGAGSDSNWNTPANWGGTAPAADDALYFGGSTRLVNTNDLALTDPSFAGLTFSSGAGAFALWGSRITLGGNVTNWSSNTQTINLPMVLSGSRMFYGSNAAITVNGILSGAGGLSVNVTNSSLTLSGNNTYDGVTYVTNGALVITHGNALGSTNGNTYVSCKTGGYIQLSGGIVVDEPITINGQRMPGYGYSLFSSSGSNTIRGAITRVSEMRFNNNGSTTLVIAGGIRNGGGGGDLVVNANGTMIFNTLPLDIGGATFWADSGGLTVLNVAGNNIGGVLSAGGTVRTDITNAWLATVTLTIGVGYNPPGTVNLNGNNQTVAKLISGSYAAGTRVLTSPTPATLTVNQSETTVFDAQLTGAVGLLKAGTGTLALSNNLSTTTGDMIVSNGTLLVAMASSLGNSTNIMVTGPSAVLELRTSSGIVDSAVLSIANNGAKVKVSAGLTETIGKLILGGVQQVNGTWGPSGSGASHIDDAHFSAGGGKIFVVTSAPITPVSATWDGEAADTLASSALNWAGDALPAFNGTTYAIFGTGGTTATVDTAFNLYGMAFNRTNSFTVEAGSGIVSNGAGGIFAQVPTTTSRSYVLSEDLVLTDHQTWVVTNNGAGVTTLTVSGKIDDGIDPYNLAKAGSGVLILSGNNAYDGATAVKTGGVLRITSANALGSTNGATVVENGGWIEMSGGINVAEPITINGDAAISYAGAIRSAGGSNVWSGLINSASRIKSNSGSLDIVGGIVGSSIVLGADSGTFIRVSEKPITVSGTFFAHTGSAIILAVPGNSYGLLEIAGNFVRTDAPNALSPSGAIAVGSGSGADAMLDLNGNSQAVGQLRTDTSNPGKRIVTSLAPATLTVTQSVATTFNGSITGAVSLVKTGTGTLTLSGTNTTFGSFVVSNGTLVVFNTGTLGANNTNVVVVAGTLALSNSLSIADSAALSIANGGGAKVYLDPSVNEKVGWLFLGGSRKSLGSYGATGSGALFIDNEHFAGTGVLTVLHDKSGTLLRLQ